MSQPADRTRRRRLGILAGIAALAVVLVVALVALTGPDDEPATAGASVKGQAATAELLAGIPQSGRFLGSPSAPVTLVEFADLQCPFCAQYARDALPTVIRDYVRPGKVRLEFRPRAFLGPDSITAAQVVMGAAQEDKLWNVLDLLYANQGAENSGWVEDGLVRRVLTAAGVDPVANRRAANSAEVGREIQDAEQLAARNGLDGTPAFLVGRRGGAFKPLQVQALTGEVFAAALDRVAAGS
jgi:protein-disulfide isomerase